MDGGADSVVVGCMKNVTRPRTAFFAAPDASHAILTFSDRIEFSSKAGGGRCVPGPKCSGQQSGNKSKSKELVFFHGILLWNSMFRPL
jgi:hypothetical protein